MQTVASLAKRLDMSPEDAVEKLRYMLFDVEGVNSVISDEEIDLLIDVDDDPSIADRVRDSKLKAIEQAKKRTERLKKANQKAAAKRKAAKEAAAAEATQATETPATAAEPATAEAASETTDGNGAVAVGEAPAAEAPAAEAAPVAEPPKPLAEILPPEAPPEEPQPVAEAAAAAEPAVVGEATTPEPKAAAPAPVEEKPKKKEKEKDKEAVPGIKIGSAIERAERPVEIIRADGTALDVPEIEVEPPAPETPAEEDEEESGVLAEAELRQEEEERRKLKFSSRPLAKPDPAVVAEVKRKAAERALRAQQARAGQASGSRRSAEVAPPRTGAGRPAPGRPAGRTGVAGPSTQPAARGKKGKKGERRRGEEEMRRSAAAAVRDYQSGGLAGGGPRRRKRRRTREEDEAAVGAEEHTEREVVEVKENMTVEELAGAMGVSVNDVILDLMDHDVLATKNQTLTFEMIQLVAERRGFDVEAVIPEEQEVLSEEPDRPEDLVPRAPVITVMGHVDHGKTTFLDRIRRANVAEGEAGGITQHIAAYDVPIGNKRVVFLDTPGHEAFTQMRARGAKVTDVVVLVVAADDGVMPQTIEAIDHAKAAEVPIVVAINKIDKPEAQPDRIRQELTRFDLVDEAWGGKTVMKDISAKSGQGVMELLELLVLEAEMLELKANPNKRARGAVIESEISRGQGPVAWVLVQSGTLRVGDSFVAGEAWGRVRTMHNSRGESVTEAGPATPVVVTGFNNLPDAGDTFVVTPDDRVARSIAEQRAMLSRQKQGQKARRITLEDLQSQLQAGEKHELNVVLKADVQGSADVFESSLSKIGNEEVRVRLVHSGVGAINESDVLLASASDAVIIGFNVTANARVQKLAEQEGVDVRTYRVIYEAIEDIRKALEGLLAPEKQEIVTGHAEVRAVFRSSAFGNIAGCYMTDGEAARQYQIRVVRDGKVVHTGKIASLRREKEDVRTVQSGFECGIKLENFEDIKVGDVIEFYRVQSVDRTLA